MGDGGGGVVVNELGDETRRHCRGGWDAVLWLGRATDPELREDPTGRLATSLRDGAPFLRRRFGDRLPRRWFTRHSTSAPTPRGHPSS